MAGPLPPPHPLYTQAPASSGWPLRVTASNRAPAPSPPPAPSKSWRQERAVGPGCRAATGSCPGIGRWPAGRRHSHASATWSRGWRRRTSEVAPGPGWLPVEVAPEPGRRTAQWVVVGGNQGARKAAPAARPGPQVGWCCRRHRQLPGGGQMLAVGQTVAVRLRPCGAAAMET